MTATKDDVKLTMDDLKQALHDFERRFTIRFGLMLIALVIAVTAINKFL